MERGHAERSGDAERLERMDEVVHLVVVPGTTGQDVAPRRLDGLEPVDVHLVEVHPGLAMREPVRHEATDAAAVGQPDGLGDPGSPGRG